MDKIEDYLNQVANSLILSETEESIVFKSLSNLNGMLIDYFGDEILEQFTIGSYTRRTILPRKVDVNSDVDFLIVFKDGKSKKPQTWMNKLKQFIQSRYPRSEIFQDHPTIVLELSHIKFELIPSYFNRFWETYHIPSKKSFFTEWVKTEPNSFNEKLLRKNARNEDRIVPLVRLIKYWNVQNGHIYNSYALEKDIVETTYYNNISLKSILYEYLSALEEIDNSDLKANELEILNKSKEIINLIKASEKKGIDEMSDYGIRLLIPPL